MSLNPSYVFERIDLATIDFSKSIAQNERRKHFDSSALAELAENVKASGVMQPIVVRKCNKPDRFELVAGERRVIAARKAGHELIPAIIRELTDDEAVDLQLVENLQREGLHELVECEGFEDLKARGNTVEQIAEKVGRSASYVYKRLELVACGPDVRKAFYEGKIDASKSLLLSRLKADDQKKSLKEITAENWNGPMSYRQAAEHVRRNYMLRLDQAPFKTEDATLVPAAGPCGTCKKNTAAQTGLFGDVSSRDAHCSDSKCFQEKTVAASAIRVKAAQAANQPVLEGKEAKKALQGGSDFSRPDRTVDGDSQYRSYQKVLGRDLAKVVIVAVDPADGKVVELVDKEAAKKLIKEKGIKLRAAGSSGPKRSQKEIDAEKAARAKQASEEKLLVAVARAIYAKEPKPLTRLELTKLADYMMDSNYGHSAVDEVFGEDIPNFSKLNEAGLIRCIRLAILAEHINDGDKNVVFDEAKRHGVNVEKIKTELAAPKPKPAADTTTSKKKAAKKK